MVASALCVLGHAVLALCWLVKPLGERSHDKTNRHKRQDFCSAVGPHSFGRECCGPNYVLIVVRYKGLGRTVQELWYVPTEGGRNRVTDA